MKFWKKKMNYLKIVEKFENAKFEAQEANVAADRFYNRLRKLVLMLSNAVKNHNWERVEQITAELREMCV